ncbi:MAG: aminotransferase class V-fold PLP-dependent enzyme [Deltaproteobacteria bacterium]|nr:aminotransferase class V-fold PLP-dependent enzyme [Deltaproteobacteria bacterium]
MIFLDYNATAPLLPSARDAMRRALEQDLGNPSSLHRAGQRARALIEAARRQVAQSLGARPGQIVLTSGATESNNLLWRGVLAPQLRLGLRPRVLLAALDHPSVAALAEQLAADGVELGWIAVDRDGRLDMQALAVALQTSPALVHVSAVGGELGTLADVPAVAALVRQTAAHLHLDAAQAWGRVPVGVDAWPVDSLALSGHKIGGPMGTGALYLRAGVRPLPLAPGHQEHGLRSGTENVLGAAGLAAAVAELPARLALAGEVRRQRDLLADQLAPIAGLRRLGPADPAAEVGTTLCVALAGVPAPLLVMALDLAGVAASAGSACSSGTAEPSALLRALVALGGLEPATAGQAVRFSLGPGLRDDALVAAGQAVAACAARIRSSRRE